MTTVFEKLHIADRRERTLVGVADLVLGGLTAPARLVRTTPRIPPRRILLLRLERIGDLLMSVGAIGAVRAAAPEAHVHLVTGSWNEPVARMIPGVDSIETLDAAWLAREGAGLQMRALMRRALAWRAGRWDLGINFEPDIRSNLLLALSGAPRRAGFTSAGGGALLTDPIACDPRAHVAANAIRLVRRVFPDVSTGASATPLRIPEEERRAAAEMLRDRAGPLVGVHASGGRAIKQWPPERFGRVAERLVEDRGATIVLTGAAGDRDLAGALRAALPPDAPVVDLIGRADLVRLAAVLERLDLLITGDTGPMHLAAAVGTPVVAVFGPSDPARYAPLAADARIVRVDLPCSPCNRIRRPPERCVGHTPDCLLGVDADAVFEAALALLQRRARIAIQPASAVTPR
jgi:lipopolysaccharide heptosyltransferase II